MFVACTDFKMKTSYHQVIYMGQFVCVRHTELSVSGMGPLEPTEASFVVQISLLAVHEQSTGSNPEMQALLKHCSSVTLLPNTTTEQYRSQLETCENTGSGRDSYFIINKEGPHNGKNC